MKTVVLVAPHFFPAFLASVHRARLWADHLPEFGWKPIILTTDPRHYECQVDSELLELLPTGLEVVRTNALPTRPVRLVGNIGLRSLPWYFAALRRLARREHIDFVHVTCDAFPAALAGRAANAFLGIPYGIDYQDPWLPETPTRHPPLSKAWLAHKLSAFLEPMALKKARLVTGINEEYFASALRRNPHVSAQAETAGMPFGSSNRDFEHLVARPRKPFLFDPTDGNFHLIYAGALLPRGREILDRFLDAVALADRDGRLQGRLRVHFVGTGLRESDSTQGHTVRPKVAMRNLGHVVDEFPARISYLDVLSHLQAASGVLILGSTERHYSPSKVYQGVMSRRPVFAVLLEESSAVAPLRASGAGRVHAFTVDQLPDPARLAEDLVAFLASGYDPGAVKWEAFDGDSARESARRLAQALDRAVARDARERSAGARGRENDTPHV